MIQEEGPSRLRLAWRRRARVGVAGVIGQMLFVGLALPALRRLGARRRRAILVEAGLDDRPYPPTHRVASVNAPETTTLLAQLQPTLVVVQGTRIIAAAVLEAAPCPFVNVHAGITPMYRGVHGGYWALADGRRDLVGTTVHVVDRGIDTGAVLAQASFAPRVRTRSRRTRTCIWPPACRRSPRRSTGRSPARSSRRRSTPPTARRSCGCTRRYGAICPAVCRGACGERGGRESDGGRTPMSAPARPGALVVSLDFELHWGMRTTWTGRTPPMGAWPGRAPYARAGRAARGAACAATWATVGFLFASSCDELQACSPAVRPTYVRRELDPYTEPVGADEEADPEHLAGSLVQRIAATPGQEVASHTFSHYYCLEAGQTVGELRADLAAAQAIAARHDLRLTSLVLPRNQWNEDYAGVVLEQGFTCVRGPQPSWGHRPSPQHGRGDLARRGARLVGTYGGMAPLPPPPGVTSTAVTACATYRRARSRAPTCRAGAVWSSGAWRA